MPAWTRYNPAALPFLLFLIPSSPDGTKRTGNYIPLPSFFDVHVTIPPGSAPFDAGLPLFEIKQPYTRDPNSMNATFLIGQDVPGALCGRYPGSSTVLA